jgi:hypothetical protein
MAGDPMGETDARSISDRAANGDSETVEELFPVGAVDGDGVSLKQLVKPGHKVETTAALSRAEVPLRNGLPDPSRRLRMLVTGIPGKVHSLPLREDDGKPEAVTGWKLAQDVRVDHVENVPLTERELILNRFAAIVDESPSAAGGLLDDLQKVLAETLATA